MLTTQKTLQNKSEIYGQGISTPYVEQLRGKH
jgi:hypothetical protein